MAPANWVERLLDLDARLSRDLRVAERPGPLHTLASFFARSGDSWFWLAGILLIWLFGPKEWRSVDQTFGLAVLGLAVVVLAVKFTIRRSRPQGEWGGVYRKTDPHSFPSGHAARASLLAVLALGLTPLPLGVLAAIWAPLVGFARVSLGVHYLSDVVAGMVLGVFAGVAVLMLI